MDKNIFVLICADKIGMLPYGPNPTNGKKKAA